MENKKDKFLHSEREDIARWIKDGLTVDEINLRIKAKLNDSLLKRALGYDIEEVKTYVQHGRTGESKKIEKKRKHIPADIKAIEET